MTKRSTHILAALAALSFLSCQFTTDVLDERRCESSSDCTGAFRCIDGICQGLLEGEDIIEDGVQPDLDAAPDPCQDLDGDLVFAGSECEAELIDCNDFDPAVFPGNDEICDGKDNDCNDATDGEDDGFLAEPCARTEGVCTGTTRLCVGGINQACTDESYGDDFESDDETLCDGLDNDCDGVVDEGISRECYSTTDGLDDPVLDVAGAPCVSGTEVCVEGGSGEFSGTCADEVVPQDEDETTDGNFELRCDGIDNDCDGTPDEACSCSPGERQDCYEHGIGVTDPTAQHPPCRIGYLLCGDNARYGSECLEQRIPDPEHETLSSSETCLNPGVDNDCNGVVDDVPQLGEDCTVSGEQGVCLTGVLVCSDGALPVCVSVNEATAETCDNPGSDDDCDGEDDNIPGRFEPCTVTRFKEVDVEGICQVGQMDCDVDLGFTCIPGAADLTETCNDLDDDCDGTPDNAVDTTEDPENCGACDRECDDDCCDSDCTDNLVDEQHCGSCGNACPDGADPAATDCCGGSCVDLTRDAAHCNACGDSCPHGGDGSAATACCPVQGGDDLTFGDCVDTETDENHCGNCGVVCSGTEQCCGGDCVALDDPSFCGDCDTDCGDDICCDGVGGLACEDNEVDGHCGGCGVTCSDADAECCDVGDAGVCIDTRFSLNNCGGCGAAFDCTTGGDTTPACCNVAEEGVCADLDDDEAHCGDCNSPCTGDGESCCGGGCTDTRENNTHCGGCDSPCTGEGMFCCASGCQDLNTNTAHCGRCGNACEGGDVCCDGFCAAACDPP